MTQTKKTGTPTSRAARKELARVEKKREAAETEVTQCDDRIAQLRQIIEQDEGTGWTA